MVSQAELILRVITLCSWSYLNFLSTVWVPLNLLLICCKVKIVLLKLYTEGTAHCLYTDIIGIEGAHGADRVCIVYRYTCTLSLA